MHDRHRKQKRYNSFFILLLLLLATITVGRLEPHKKLVDLEKGRRLAGVRVVKVVAPQQVGLFVAHVKVVQVDERSMDQSYQVV